MKNDGAWFLYILECCDGTLYTGITNDLSRRLIQHAEGTGSRYTRSRLPVRLRHSEPCPSRSSALKQEYAMKQLSKKEKEAYIKRAAAKPSGRKAKGQRKNHGRTKS